MSKRRMFEELKEEGIITTEEASYFQNQATFDLECYCDREEGQEIKNIDKLNWESGHVPLGVSMCRNIPDYQAPKCFLTNGNSKFRIYLVLTPSSPSPQTENFCCAKNTHKYLKLSKPQEL